MATQEILQSLVLKYPRRVRPIYKLPDPYCPGGIEDVKAIYLGCDPSNRHSQSLPFAFAHESGLPIFNSFIKSHEAQLRQLELRWEDVYAQNLCKNYFDTETSGNTKLWEQIANEYWIENLKEELEIFKPCVPVLMTAGVIYTVLLNPGQPIGKPADFYNGTVPIPIEPKNNKLNRPLIPMYRHWAYKLSLDQWSDYRNKIIKIIDDCWRKTWRKP
jgi:hypothetical protein